MADVKSKAAEIIAEAQSEIVDEVTKEYRDKLVTLYRRRASARKVLANVDKEIEIAEAELKREVD